MRHRQYSEPLGAYAVCEECDISSTDRSSIVNIDIFDGMEDELTQTHIDKGLRDLCRECPVALCVSEMVAKHESEIGEVVVEVGAKQLRLHTGDWDAPFLTAELDILLRAWVDDFDNGLPVREGVVFIKKDGFSVDIAGERIQRWQCGIQYPHNA